MTTDQMEFPQADTSPESNTVLIVDDEKDTRDIFGIYLEKSGYQVQTAANGEEALDRLDSAVDIVLLDRRMPDMTGIEVLETIRTGPHDCRVAIITAVAPEEEILSFAVDDYLTKPVSGGALVEAVDQLVALDSYEQLLTRYHRLARLHERFRSGASNRPPVHFLETLREKRIALERRLEELEAQLPDEQFSDAPPGDDRLSV